MTAKHVSDPFALTFMAPPDAPENDQVHERGAQVEAQEQVNWLPKAKAAAGALGVTQEQVALTLANPDEARPDARDPRCTVFQRDNLTVVTGREGRVIAVRRTKRT